MPAVMVVDDELPDGRGTDLVREVQSAPRWRRTRVVFCTSAEPWRRRILARMAPVIHKPFRIGEVERVLREAFED